MSNVFQIARLGLQLAQERVEVASENAAHATVPGYRRQVSTHPGVSFEQLMSGPTQAAANITMPAAPDRQRGVDLTPANATSTGRALDAAIIAKKGFFVLTEGDRTYLTRQGNFHVDPAGWLSGAHGLRVQGENGDIFVGNETVSLAEDGRVMAGERVLARLAIKAPQDPTALRLDARGLLFAPEADLERVESNLRVAHVEGSNTDSTKEMLGMMTSLRQYESLVRVVQSYDEMLGRTIQKLSEA